MKKLISLLAVACACMTAACDTLSVEDCAEGEVFLTVASDIAGEDDSTRCTAAPDDCADAPTCDCLGTTAETSPINWAFCVDEGSCTETEAGVEVSCPGG